jgi:hypothetical protein
MTYGHHFLPGFSSGYDQLPVQTASLYNSVSPQPIGLSDQGSIATTGSMPLEQARAIQMTQSIDTSTADLTELGRVVHSSIRYRSLILTP